METAQIKRVGQRHDAAQKWGVHNVVHIGQVTAHTLLVDAQSPVDLEMYFTLELRLHERLVLHVRVVHASIFFFFFSRLKRKMMRMSHSLAV